MKRLFLSAALLVALLAAYYALQRREFSKTEAEDAAKQLVRMPLANVKTIDVIRSVQQPPVLKFERRDDKWWIVSPIEYRANQITVSGLVTQFDNKKYEREFTVDDLAKFDLAPSQYTVTFTTEQGSETILVGKKTPVDNNIYAKRADAEGVFVVSAGFTYNIEKPLDDYREKEVFWQYPEAVTRVGFTASGEAWQIEKKGDVWFGHGLTLATDKVEPLLTRLESMRIRDHIPNEVAAERAYRIENTLTIQGTGGAVSMQRLEFAAQELGDDSASKTYRMRIVDRDEWVTISDYVYDGLWKRPHDLVPDPPQPEGEAGDLPAEDVEQMHMPLDGHAHDH